MPSYLHLASTSSAVATPGLGGAIKVVLADDHASVRRSLRTLLDAEEGVEVIAEASDLAAARESVSGDLPQVLVLDLEMPNSLPTIGRLRASSPGTEIVVLTMDESPVFAQRAINAGALGFVLKHKADAELLVAVRAAARGEEYVSPAVANRLERLRNAIGEGSLSPRELEVLRLIALGYTSAEIATQLRLSRRTIDSHRARIHRKLGLTTRAQLVRYALSGQLI
ncbi:MAG: response regulator transcription factor [Solirubrobacterales bacterium]|nr:response regulator transcription factor [Solirubrobacterales bacterium]MBV9915814.1 response regulator transcription factor [Solirubrobacterales bacterium]